MASVRKVHPIPKRQARLFVGIGLVVLAILLSIVINVLLWYLLKSWILNLHLILRIFVLMNWVWLIVVNLIILRQFIVEWLPEFTEFEKKFELFTIRDFALQQIVSNALEYYKRVDATVKRARSSPLRAHMRETVRDVDNWLDAIYTLAKRLDVYQADVLVRQDRDQVRQDISNLTVDLKKEKDLAVKTQIQETHTSKQEYLDSLERLDSTMRRARYLLEQSITALATASSEVQLIDAKNMDGPRARRLRQDVADQVAHLRDVVNTMDEVYHREF